MRDLLGHYNALEGTFQPSEVGLFEHLIDSQEEFTVRASQSGLHLVCLDEMNLAHVEHYFHGFLQILEQNESSRVLRCFNRHAVGAQSQFSQWASLRLPKTLRFIGTVNFDETTRELSQRLLDRANLIQLPSDTIARELGGPQDTTVDGPPVTLQTYRSWLSQTQPLSHEFAKLIDDLREPFRILGSPINPRRMQAMSQFIASYPRELSEPTEAIDFQIAQRLLPQVRGLFRTKARQAIDQIRGVLERSENRFPESLRILGIIHEGDSFAFNDERVDGL
jgi:hypothetical protein